ncbi:serine/threonine protein phosphatase, putative [Eimeria maxima]|uniref:Serine/threonine protein phosphatase, putative n=1 Tax=Eimeria maxima TaxID=5804 RepID=U6MDC0_EIMMA|nr:serine/threonine protein phosphatase, putative [Eimeria maxima]CDJ61028.1 serine/threonine protein phosphatase, putative [Eimeria maxima]
MLIKVESSEFRFPGDEDRTKWSSPFTFALIADPQLGLFKNNNSWSEELQQAKECMEAAAAHEPQPAFIFVLGDLVHAPVPAHNTGSNAAAIRTVRDEQARDLKEALDKPSKEVPVLVIPGNHDVGERPTLASIEDYENIWGKANFSFWFGGVKFVAANSSLFYNDSASPQAAEVI